MSGQKLGVIGAIVLVLAGIAIVVVAQMRDDDDETAATTTSNPIPGFALGEGEIAAVQKDFIPETKTVVAGSTVTFHNADTFAHTVTADDGSFDTGEVAGGTDVQFTVGEAGTVTYHCEIHSTMKGTLVIVNGSG